MGIFSRKPKAGETAEQAPSKLTHLPKSDSSKFTKADLDIIDKLNSGDALYCADCGDVETFNTPRELLEHKKKVHGIDMMYLLKAVDGENHKPEVKSTPQSSRPMTGSKNYEISIFFVSGEDVTMGDCNEKELADLERELKDASIPFFEMRGSLFSKRNIERVDVEEVEGE